MPLMLWREGTSVDQGVTHRSEWLAGMPKEHITTIPAPFPLPEPSEYT